MSTGSDGTGVEAASATAPDVTPLLEPRDGVPPVTDSPAALADVVKRMAAGEGPVAVDAERASGYRYGQRAYLVQLRRAGAGTALIDPIAVPDLSELSAVLEGVEWVLHAANQDLPCLAGVGMRPTHLFDTELAARLAGYQRVGLATMAELVLGQQLAKEHSAVDWSTRPLPEPWLRYAALDVEILVDLRDKLAAELDRQGKLGWAHEEFQAIVDAPPPPPRVDPWRRTSGIHRVRNRRQLAVVRELWQARDEIAQRRDVAPGRVLPDSAIVAAAVSAPTGADDLGRIAGWGGRSTRRLVPRMWPVIERARQLSDGQLPPSSLPSDAPPPPRSWADRDPAAAARLDAARATVQRIAEEHGLPVENLLSPDSVRRLAWSPPDPADTDGVADALARAGARGWQRGLTAAPLAAALTDPEAHRTAEQESPTGVE